MQKGEVGPTVRKLVLKYHETDMCHMKYRKTKSYHSNPVGI